MLEVSNLSEYSAWELSLLIKGIDLKIRENNDFIKECKRWGKDFVNLHQGTIVSLAKDIETLYELRVRVVTVHQSVMKKQIKLSR